MEEVARTHRLLELHQNQLELDFLEVLLVSQLALDSLDQLQQNQHLEVEVELDYLEAQEQVHSEVEAQAELDYLEAQEQVHLEELLVLVVQEEDYSQNLQELDSV